MFNITSDDGSYWVCLIDETHTQRNRLENVFEKEKQLLQYLKIWIVKVDNGQTFNGYHKIRGSK